MLNCPSVTAITKRIETKYFALMLIVGSSHLLMIQ
jgi:hypothetical protein